MTTTTTTNGFRKGDAVVEIGNYDRKGTFYIARATVHSCGKKQMVLNQRSDSSVCLGRHFNPTQLQRCLGVVLPDDGRDFEAVALMMAGSFLMQERARYLHCIESAATLRIGREGYIRAMQNDLAQLHEPRVIAR